tara:strand:- start:444 stop:1361 length:918 start_codon:yes stop_codon:yes gene_type:complete
MSNISPHVLNELFIQKLGTQEGLDKIAMEGSAFIRNKLREVSYARKVINPEYVTKLDLQRSTLHDGLTKIVDIEPDSAAVAINLRGQAPTRYVEGERYEIPFYMISSEDFQKTEEELLAYEMPLTEVIERNSVKDIQAVEDSRFLAGIDAAITATGNTSADAATTTATLPRASFKTLFDFLDGNFLKAECMLMNTKTFNRLFLYSATTVGDQVGSEQHVNGFTYSTLFGRKLIVTNKTSGDGGITDDTIYAFTAQEFLGNFYILVDTKFWVDKKKNLITWAAYETIGMGIGNTSACASVTHSALA